MLDTTHREKYTWTAYYHDSTELNQNDGTGIKTYNDIDRTRLAAFGIKYDGELIYRVFLEPGQKLIYRRRSTGNVSNDSSKLPVDSELILVGTQQNIKGFNVQNIAYIDVATGLIQHAGRWVGGEPTLTLGERNEQ